MSPMALEPCSLLSKYPDAPRSNGKHTATMKFVDKEVCFEVLGL